MTDIVKRLRSYVSDRWGTAKGDMHRAAEEIESLRRELANALARDMNDDDKPAGHYTGSVTKSVVKRLAAQVGVPLAGDAPAPSAEKSESQRLADAGYRKRDHTFECDECGKRFSRLMLPIHRCEKAEAQSAEPVAIRHSFDGYGWMYLDSGSGSDWLERGMRMPDAEPVFAGPRPTESAKPVATVVSESGRLDVTMSWWHEPALPVGAKLYAGPIPAPARLTDADIAALSWHLSAVRDYEAYTGQEKLIVEGEYDFARAVESMTRKAFGVED